MLHLKCRCDKQMLAPACLSHFGLMSRCWQDTSNCGSSLHHHFNTCQSEIRICAKLQLYSFISIDVTIILLINPALGTNPAIVYSSLESTGFFPIQGFLELFLPSYSLATIFIYYYNDFLCGIPFHPQFYYH